MPPSVNKLYANKKKGGRFKTKDYRHWLDEADRWFLLQKRSIKPVRGKCSIRIILPPTRADRSNLIKAAEDFLVSREITGDDRHNMKVSVETDMALENCCEIWITPLTIETT